MSPFCAKAMAVGFFSPWASSTLAKPTGRSGKATLPVAATLELDPGPASTLAPARTKAAASAIRRRPAVETAREKSDRDVDAIFPDRAAAEAAEMRRMGPLRSR